MTDDASPRDSSADELADRPVFRALVDEVRDRLAADSTGHDVAHARRVFRLGMRLARAEGADPEVVGAAALTHDLHRVMGDGVHPEESLSAVKAVLERVGFPREKVPDVLHCVEVHDEYEFRGDPRPAERHRFTEAFVDRFEREWHGRE